MRRRPRTHEPSQSHNYMHKELEMLRSGRIHPGQVNLCHVYHDDWCDLVSGRGFCNCDPEIHVTHPEDN